MIAADCRRLPNPEGTLMVGGHGAKLSRKQELAIAALLTAGTIGEAAGAVGVGERTLRGWMKLPGFHRAYHDARRELLAAAVGRLQAASGVALDALVDVAQNGRPSERIRAAAVLLTHARMGIEAVEEPSQQNTSVGPPIPQTVDGRRTALLELIAAIKSQALEPAGEIAAAT